MTCFQPDLVPITHAPERRNRKYVIFHNKAGAPRNERYYHRLPNSEEQAL